jgi:hypothetical protein
MEYRPIKAESILILSKFRDFSTTHFKIIFRPNFFVGGKFLILEILQYVCGLKFASASNLYLNLYFEMSFNPWLSLWPTV